MKLLVFVLSCIISFYSSTADADYAKGCADPEYHRYMQDRFTYYEKRNLRFLSDSLRDYKRSLTSSRNPYQVIGDLSRHLKYSAQFEPVSDVLAKIDRIFEHADELSIKQQIAGDAVDNFSGETHAVGIARAWIAYRQSEHELAFEELMKSIDVGDSAVLSSFGPDFEFIRHIYREGHIEPVLAYIDKTKAFWTGKRPDGLRYVWLKMIGAECKIQFDSMDSIKVLELGL